MGATVSVDLQEGESLEEALVRLSQKPKKEKKVTVSDPMAGDTPDPMVYSVVHVYQREGEPDGIVRSNATRERKMHGPGVLVFAHLHHYGLECTSSCKERIL